MNSTAKLALYGLAITMLPPAHSQDRKLTRAQPPAVVAATIDREAKGATIKSFATEREGGKTVYEAETVVDGHSRDVQVAEDGTLNEIEEEIALDSLPQPVQRGLKAKANGAAIIKVESLTKEGKLVAYEAAPSKNGHKGEVQVGPNGAALHRPGRNVL